MTVEREKAEDIVMKLRQVEVLQGQGKSVSDVVRHIGLTEVTYYRWRSEYGGMKGDQVKRLKELEAENNRYVAQFLISPSKVDPEGSRTGKLLIPLRRCHCIDRIGRQCRSPGFVKPSPPLPATGVRPLLCSVA
jgi:putative transposase